MARISLALPLLMLLCSCGLRLSHKADYSTTSEEEQYRREEETIKSYQEGESYEEVFIYEHDSLQKEPRLREHRRRLTSFGKEEHRHARSQDSSKRVQVADVNSSSQSESQPILLSPLWLLPLLGLLGYRWYRRQR